MEGYMKTTSFKGRDFLAETDFTREEIETNIKCSGITQA